MRFALFQIDAASLINSDPHLVKALAQDLILDTTVKLAVESDLYRHTASFTTETDLPDALADIHFAAAGVSLGTEILTDPATMRHPERSDLIVSEDGQAWVHQGSWFSPYRHTLPAIPAMIRATLEHDVAMALA